MIRTQNLNNIEKQDGDCVVYIMSRDQRVKDNHALIEAYNLASIKNLPLIVCFVLYPAVKNRALNQYLWMIEGLKEVENDLAKLNIGFKLYFGKASESYKKIEKELKPHSIYFDFSPLKGPLKVKESYAANSRVPIYVVDTHNIVPTFVASQKEEFAARTFRPKILSKLSEFLVEPQKLKPLKTKLKNFQNDWDNIIRNIKAENLESYYPKVKAGEEEALKILKSFLEDKIQNYSKDKNDPTKNGLSNLSAYLHFGQISSLRVVLEILKKYEHKEVESFLEEIIVRKELSDNFCFYNKNYDDFMGLKPWAQNTLNKHQKDKREFLYSLKDFESAKTHDSAWNASQIEMMRFGKMHGYMRMYWAKKIFEWSKSPKDAIKTAIFLNDKYSLDGYDPNGYVGILWSIGGLHDRPWFEREIFGQIRFMNFNGLKRKFDVERYVKGKEL